MSEFATDNIISLEEYGEAHRGLGSVAGARALREVRELAVIELRESMHRILENVDDALFSRAEKAENSLDQTLYFDAMRELRIIRKDIEQDFISQLKIQFNKGVPRTTLSDTDFSPDAAGEYPDNGLIDKDDLEEELAIANIVNKARGTCAQSLFELDQRMGFLLHDPDLENWHNPLGPEAICESFRKAAGHIETGIEIRLLVFKLFDQHIALKFDALFEKINQHLIELGVLPEIEPRSRNTANEHSVVPPLARAEAAHPGFDRVAEGDSFASAETTPAAISSSKLPAAGANDPLQMSISVLSAMQHGESPEQSEYPDIESLQPVVSDLASGQVNVLHGLRNSPLIRDLGESGDATIDMVAMLFDYILDDSTIPDAMRALIGRLQIPVLKVALLDHEFFSSKLHPARQLLNYLAASAVGWDEQAEENALLYRKIEAIVQSVLDRFDTDISLFETLLGELELFLNDYEEQAELRAERSVKVMEGQERLEVAESTTMEEIRPRIEDNNLVFVREFVTTHWKNLLFVTCARHGKNSDAWKQSVATMDELIWSVKPKHTLEDCRRLLTMQPRLLQKLREGMESLSIPATERDDFIAKLIQAQGRTAVNLDAKPMQEIPRPETAAEPVAQTGATTENSTPVSGLCEALQVNEGERIPDIDDEFRAMAGQLSAGSWMEFYSSHGETKRAKLSWISPITETCLFTDRLGLKAGNYSLVELAHMLRCQRARILDAAPLMDRAVDSVLKEYQDQ